jgi:MtrB/PioB family decaheme-associated outer membrane protein
MKTIRLLVLIVLSTQIFVVAADNLSPAIPAVDISKWKCKYCVVEEGWSGEVELGLGNVSDDSFKFGEYTGLNQQGGYFVGNANLYYRDQDASYLDLSVSDLGLVSRSLSIEGGLQGQYKLFLHYDEIPHFISDTAMTPYSGSGSETLTLPTGWVPAGTTDGMTGLAASLKNVDLETHRKRIGVGLSISPDSPWGYDVKYRHETKEGIKRAAGSFFFNAAQLPEPVDYVTDEVDVSVSYSTKKWQANLAYYGSTFRNNNKSLIWDNAFTPLVTGAVEGELAQPPDNQFHQFVLSVGYELGDRSRISGDVAIGRMEQNDSLLAATKNASILGSLPSLPTDSANAEVDTVDAKFKVISMPTEKLRLNAAFSYNDRDNQTPQLAYDWVTTDSFAAMPRTNLPYSFTKSAVNLSADYKIAKRTRLGVGYDIDTRERTFQQIDKTKENTLWGRLRVRSIKKLFFEFKLARAERDTSAYKAVSDIDPPQNILLRKYNMADRVRTTVGMHINISPKPKYTMGLNLDIANNDYDKSILGLTESNELSINGDITALLSENTSVNFFLGHEQIESTQTGSQTFAGADWSANNDDTFDTMGFSVTHVLIEHKLDIGADYTKSRSTGKIAFSSGTPDTAFPELNTDLDSLKLYANYHLNKMITLRAAYWYERYEADDWAVDGVSSDTIPNVLSFGEKSPYYDINVIKLSMVYKF